MNLKLLQLFLVMPFFLYMDAKAQACQGEFEKANTSYTGGNFDESKAYIQSCFNKSNVTSRDLANGYRLLALNYLGLGKESDMRGAIIELIRIDSNFQPDKVLDPPVFVKMVEEVTADYESLSTENDANPDKDGSTAETEGENDVVGIYTDPVTAAGRALVFPLWGHLSLRNSKNTARGALYTALFIGSMGLAIYGYAEFDRVNYFPEDFLVLAAGINVLAAADAFLSAKILNIKAEKSNGITLSFYPNLPENTLYLGLVYKF